MGYPYAPNDASALGTPRTKLALRSARHPNAISGRANCRIHSPEFTTKFTESAAIVAYLSERYASADNRLLPSGQSDRARWLEWCFFIMTELDASSLYVIRRHSGLKDVYGDAPAAVEAARAYFLKQLQRVVEALTPNSGYLMGEQFTTADILLTTCLTTAIWDEISLPNICIEYLNKTTARPAYLAAFAANYPQNKDR